MANNVNTKTELPVYPTYIEFANNRYQLGEVILAKMKGFCPWPAWIKEICGYGNRKRSIIVEFFGTNDE